MYQLDSYVFYQQHPNSQTSFAQMLQKNFCCPKNSFTFSTVHLIYICCWSKQQQKHILETQSFQKHSRCTCYCCCTNLNPVSLRKKSGAVQNFLVSRTLRIYERSVSKQRGPQHLRWLSFGSATGTDSITHINLILTCYFTKNILFIFIITIIITFCFLVIWSVEANDRQTNRHIGQVQRHKDLYACAVSMLQTLVKILQRYECNSKFRYSIYQILNIENCQPFFSVYQKMRGRGMTICCRKVNIHT